MVCCFGYAGLLVCLVLEYLHVEVKAELGHEGILVCSSAMTAVVSSDSAHAVGANWMLKRDSLFVF